MHNLQQGFRKSLLRDFRAERAVQKFSKMNRTLTKTEDDTQFSMHAINDYNTKYSNCHKNKLNLKFFRINKTFQLQKSLYNLKTMIFFKLEKCRCTHPAFSSKFRTSLYLNPLLLIESKCSQRHVVWQKVSQYIEL